MSEPPKRRPPKVTGTWLGPPHPHPGPLGLHFSAWSPCKNQIPSAFELTRLSWAEDSQQVCMLPDSAMRQFLSARLSHPGKGRRVLGQLRLHHPDLLMAFPTKRRVYSHAMSGGPGGHSHEHPFLGAHPRHPWAEVTETLFLTQNLLVLHLIVTIEDKSMTPF